MQTQMRKKIGEFFKIWTYIIYIFEIWYKKRQWNAPRSSC